MLLSIVILVRFLLDLYQDIAMPQKEKHEDNCVVFTRLQLASTDKHVG